MFNFEINYDPDYDGRGTKDYEVELPHQCDNWNITNPEDRHYGPQPSKADAIDRMKRFIVEAQEALHKLEDLPE